MDQRNAKVLGLSRVMRSPSPTARPTPTKTACFRAMPSKRGALSPDLVTRGAPSISPETRLLRRPFAWTDQHLDAG